MTMARIILDDNDNVENGTPEDDFIDGRGGNDILRGSGGADTIKGGDGNDQIDAFNAGENAGRHVLYGGAGDDPLIQGSVAGDRMDGGTGNDVLRGMGGSDVMFGRDGNDVLLAGNFTNEDGIEEGRSTLNGGAGNDRMNAGNDADTFIGGTGADTFEFTQEVGEPVYDSGVGRGNRDRVLDFKGGQGDKISFQFIADDLTFVGGEAAPGVNEVGFIETGGVTILRANTLDGAADVDFEIQLSGTGLGLSADDFIL
jgi:Ca2+-binding RTX toxin-like protein